MHRRKTSKEENLESTTKLEPTQIPFPEPLQTNGGAQATATPPRTRVNSVPTEPYKLSPRPAPPPSAGPFRTSFNSVSSSSSPNGSVNGNGLEHPYSPHRAHFSHTRTLSSSGAPTFSPSPLAGAFPARSNTLPESPSFRFPNAGSPPTPQQNGGPPSPTATRRHARIHSRNLSVFFPRPGSLPQQSIAEDADADGGQDVEYSESVIPSANNGAVQLQSPPGPRKLGEGFSFGGKAPRMAAASSSSSDGSATAASPRTTRRGHHHKHSMSHNFFSFLEPGSALQSTASEPGSPWNPISPFPQSAAPTTASFAQNGAAVAGASVLAESAPPMPMGAVLVSVCQFLLGASLWVSGQQNGSLGCTGLGYWVVFDAFGVALEHVVPAYLAQDSMRSETRRPYGTARVETLLLFAQTVYLIFSSVYVCKETVEHLLLSAEESHHHHPWDEDVDAGIPFPLFLIFMTIISLISTCLFYDNHSKLIRTSGHQLPSFTSIFRSSRLRAAYSYTSPSTPAALVISNPFTAAPLLFSIALFGGALFVPPLQQPPFDLLLAAVETVLTFSVAYPASVILGAVLLQTSPARGMPGGRMESFLRTMREIERHPNVLHLPAPHIWQLAPSSVAPAAGAGTGAVNTAKDVLVVTIELHVRRDLADDEVLDLTRWAHDRCKLALGLGSRALEKEDTSEVTVGIVRG